MSITANTPYLFTQSSLKAFIELIKNNPDMIAEIKEISQASSVPMINGFTYTKGNEETVTVKIPLPLSIGDYYATTKIDSVTPAATEKSRPLVNGIRQWNNRYEMEVYDEEASTKKKQIEVKDPIGIQLTKSDVGTTYDASLKVPSFLQVGSAFSASNIPPSINAHLIETQRFKPVDVYKYFFNWDKGSIYQLVSGDASSVTNTIQTLFGNNNWYTPYTNGGESGIGALNFKTATNKLEGTMTSNIHRAQIQLSKETSQNYPLYIYGSKGNQHLHLYYNIETNANYKTNVIPIDTTGDVIATEINLKALFDKTNTNTLGIIIEFEKQSNETVEFSIESIGLITDRRAISNGAFKRVADIERAVYNPETQYYEQEINPVTNDITYKITTVTNNSNYKYRPNTFYYEDPTAQTYGHLVLDTSNEYDLNKKYYVHQDTSKIMEELNGLIIARKVYGAVYNDYAEYRQSQAYEPGRCIIEQGNGVLVLATERLQPGGNIISDTFGFSIGSTLTAQTPVAVCGRVLAYPYENILEYSAGDAVCSGPNGTVSKMSREEIKEWPDRIIGYVSEIPTYDFWGTDNVPVNGRIWIKIK